MAIATFSACVAKTSENHTNVNRNHINLPSTKFNHVTEILSFTEAFSSLTPKEQKLKIVASKQALVKNKNHLIHRIKLASMLALTSSNLRDPLRAKKMLGKLLRENTLNAEDSALVNLLHEYARMNHYLLQHTINQTKKMQKKNKALLQKNEVLKQKINDLKNIEKTMIKRNTKTDNTP
jgi:Na+/phosphate symporter